MSQPAWQHLAWIAAALLMAALVGALFDHALLFVALGLGVVLAYELFNLLRLEQWLRRHWPHREARMAPNGNKVQPPSLP